MISPSKIFVKPVSGERELEVTKHEIIPIAYGFIKPGDKVEVTPVNANKEEGIGKNLTILKYVYLSCTYSSFWQHNMILLYIAVVTDNHLATIVFFKFL